MDNRNITGACQCGAVNYEIAEPVRAVDHCHCSMCRKLHGALFASFGVVRRSDLTLRGEDNLGDYMSSANLHRQFCRTCGAQIMGWTSDEPDRVFICLGTLDAGQDPGHDKAKERHIYWESRVSWYDPGDALPRVTEDGGGFPS